MKYSPFHELYNRDSGMPKEIKHKLTSIVNLDPDEIVDNGIFDAAWICCKAIREEMYRQEGENIKMDEKNEQYGYSNCNLSTASNNINISLNVELRNNKRNNRKQGKICS